MLWALLSSAFVIYLYRKQRAAAQPHTGDHGDGMSEAVAEFEKLNDRLDRLEEKLSRT